MAGIDLARSIVGALAVVFLITAILFALLLVAPGVFGAEGAYVVQSDSMSPAIGAGDMVVTTGVNANDLEEGMVITFQTTERQSRVTHRIIAVEERDGMPMYVTKGDANEEPDAETVAPSQVAGRVWFTVPLLGHLVAFAGTDLGLLTLVVLPAIALVSSEIYSLYAATRESTKDTGGGNSE